MDVSVEDITPILGMLEGLRDADEEESIEALHSLIREDPYVLDKFDKIPFVETPLHIAASSGHTRFAMEIMRLKPSLARKLNQDSFSPMHIALQNNQTQVVRRLLDVNEDLVRVQGREGETPLHYVVQTGDNEESLDLLAEFLKVCPRSIEDVTIRRETILHVAVKYKMIDAFQLVLGWLGRAWFKNASLWEKKLLNEQDDEGNTVLHTAVSRNLPQFVKLILKPTRFFWWHTVDINAKNPGGHTAFEMSLQGDNQQMKRMLCRARCFSPCWKTAFFGFDLCCRRVASHANYLKSGVNIEEKLYVFFLRLATKISNDLRNVLLVVAALLVTVSFQSVLSPPGGFWQENKYDPRTGALVIIAGTSTMYANSEFPIIAALNLISFYSTVFIIFLLLPSGFGTLLFCLPLYTLSVCFIASLSVISPADSYLTPVLAWIWYNFTWFCVFSTIPFQLFVGIVGIRRNKLVKAFLPKVKVLETTLS